MTFENYAGVAVIEVINSADIAISSISITHSEVSLSGGWVIKLSEVEKIENILFNKIIVELGDCSSLISVIPRLKSQISTFKAFLEGAKLESEDAVNAFVEYQRADLAKRKKIARPTFFEWPSDIDLTQIGKTLRHYGLQDKIIGTDKEMEHVLSAARLLKFFIQKWQIDEQIRSNRKYVLEDLAKVTILPPRFFKVTSDNEN